MYIHVLFWQNLFKQMFLTVDRKRTHIFRLEYRKNPKIPFVRKWKRKPFVYLDCTMNLFFLNTSIKQHMSQGLELNCSQNQVISSVEKFQLKGFCYSFTNNYDIDLHKITYGSSLRFSTSCNNFVLTNRTRSIWYLFTLVFILSHLIAIDDYDFRL